MSNTMKRYPELLLSKEMSLEWNALMNETQADGTKAKLRYMMERKVIKLDAAVHLV